MFSIRYLFSKWNELGELFYFFGRASEVKSVFFYRNISGGGHQWKSFLVILFTKFYSKDFVILVFIFYGVLDYLWQSIVDTSKRKQDQYFFSIHFYRHRFSSALVFGQTTHIFDIFLTHWKIFVPSEGELHKSYRLLINRDIIDLV